MAYNVAQVQAGFPLIPNGKWRPSSSWRAAFRASADAPFGTARLGMLPFVFPGLVVRYKHHLGRRWLVCFRFHCEPTSIPKIYQIPDSRASQPNSTNSDALRRWPVGKPRARALQRAISKDHPRSLFEVGLEQHEVGMEVGYRWKWETPPVFITFRSVPFFK